MQRRHNYGSGSANTACRYTPAEGYYSLVTLALRERSRHRESVSIGTSLRRVDRATILPRGLSNGPSCWPSSRSDTCRPIVRVMPIRCHRQGRLLMESKQVRLAPPLAETLDVSATMVGRVQNGVGSGNSRGRGQRSAVGHLDRPSGTICSRCLTGRSTFVLNAKGRGRHDECGPSDRLCRIETRAFTPWRPTSAKQIAEAAGLQERYVREWLPRRDGDRRYLLEHDSDAATLSPATGARSVPDAGCSNVQHRDLEYLLSIPLIANVEDEVVECFQERWWFALCFVQALPGRDA